MMVTSTAPVNTSNTVNLDDLYKLLDMIIA